MGEKLGYFFTSVKWLGFELEGYTSNPNIAKRDIGIMGIPVDLNGADLQVATAAINLALRYPFKRFEPYIGVGPVIVYAKVSNRENSVEAVTPGLNVVTGSRFFLLDWLALYTEYKFHYAKFDFENNDIQLQAGIVPTMFMLACPSISNKFEFQPFASQQKKTLRAC